MSITINTDVATFVSAASSTIYAIISALSLWLLSRQIRDARRFGAAPALYALLKELELHMTAVRQLGSERPEDPLHAPAADPQTRETLNRCLEFFERIEHLRSAGVLPATTLRRAFGPVLQAYLADPRFAELIRQDADKHQEVLRLAQQIVPH